MLSSKLESENSCMNILYTCDNNYIWLMGISMVSVFKNNPLADDLCVYLIGDNVSDDNIRKLKKIAQDYSRKFEYIPLPELNIPESLYSERWPKSAYTRLFCAEILPKDVKNIVYLDCDIVVNDEISDIELYLKPDTVFGGVKDCVGKNYKTNIGMKANDAYINAGVLVINVDLLRTINIYDRINIFLQKYGKIINYADQDVLNGCFCDRSSTLPLEYNLMTSVACWDYKYLSAMRSPNVFYTQDEYNFAKSNPKIIHYTTNMLTIRPWYSNSNHPFKGEFLKYFSISPWKNQAFSEMKFTGVKNGVLKMCLSLPLGIACPILGFIHSNLLPFIKRRKNRKG